MAFHFNLQICTFEFNLKKNFTPSPGELMSLSDMFAQLQRKISACPKTAKVRKSAQKGVKRRKKATSWRKKAHAWRQKASIGALWRLLTPFSELGKTECFVIVF
jgi:hypothetical protein